MNCLSTRTAAPAIVAALCFLTTVAGCQSHNRQTAPDGVQQPTSGSSTNLGQGLTTVTLTDASFGGMKAAEISVPKGWRAQGQMATPPCTNLPSSSSEAISPDGQSQMNVLPPFGWRWGMGSQNGVGCIPLTGPLPAADFLQKFAARLKGVRVVGPMPFSDAFRSREENFTNNANSQNSHQAPAFRSRHTGDVAAIQAVDATGHEMRLRAWVECMELYGRWQGGNCWAIVDILRAPKGRLNGLVALVDSRQLVRVRFTEEYQAALANRQQQISNRLMDQGRRDMEASGQRLAQGARDAEAASQMQHNEYLSNMATQQANHEANMQQMQSATNSSMRATQNSMNARSTSASDMEDYSLNQQTVSGANGTYKTSSQYSNVWSSPVGPANSDGRTFGSTDNTVDPNSATDNTWTKDTKVHGNGQPQ
ncbi:MAG TPA: hypothetical protein VHX63_13255 [Acidobacteriaceae bacterium]|jgi:hypothetical protein|nr:hypothetical protein [Acidobacteriaceae bacterium]